MLLVVTIPLSFQDEEALTKSVYFIWNEIKCDFFVVVDSLI